MITAVVFDLDGVVRHFDPETVADIERRHGLEPGGILAAAFAERAIADVTTGEITRAQWVRVVGEAVGSPTAAAEWGSQPSHVDDEVLRLSDRLRADGIATAVLTNGTDTIPAEVAQQGIAPHFDAIYNSATIGYAKPDVRAFQHVLDGLGVRGDAAFFTDDSPSKLAGADALGMVTHHFTDVENLRRALADAGVATT